MAYPWTIVGGGGAGTVLFSPFRFIRRHFYRYFLFVLCGHRYNSICCKFENSIIMMRLCRRTVLVIFAFKKATDSGDTPPWVEHRDFAFWKCHLLTAKCKCFSFMDALFMFTRHLPYSMQWEWPVRPWAVPLPPGMERWRMRAPGQWVRGAQLQRQWSVRERAVRVSTRLPRSWLWHRYVHNIILALLTDGAGNLYGIPVGKYAFNE